jgi:hypothetical protein
MGLRNFLKSFVNIFERVKNTYSNKELRDYNFSIFILFVFVLFLLYLVLYGLYSLGTDDLGYFDVEIFYQNISPYLFMASLVYSSFMLGLISRPVYCEKCKKTTKEMFIFQIFPSLHYISKTHLTLILIAISYFVHFLYYFSIRTDFLEEVSKEYWPLIILIGILIVLISFSFYVGRLFRLVYGCKKCDSWLYIKGDF